MKEIVNDPLIINNNKFKSRLMVGTGKYKNLIETKESLEASEASIVTVAVRRFDMEEINESSNLMNTINWDNFWLLPNTAGAKTAEEAIRLAFLGRELAKRINQPDNNFVKLEVISDSKYLLPDPIGTIKAAQFLVKRGFTVLPYINADPMLAKHLEDIGCSTVMPLGSPIGSGQGIKNLSNIQIIIENSKIPVVIDAGLGSPSEASLAMQIGADAVLINTAIAKANDSIKMAQAMNLGVIAGRLGYLAGQIKPSKFASPSSTVSGLDFLTT